MATYTWAGFYAAQFDTPLGSAIVAPGRVVEWPDGPPNQGHGWVESPDEEPSPFEELATQEESSSDSVEGMPENIPAAETTAVAEPASPAGDETPADTVSTQVTDTGSGDTTDQTEPEPATSKRSSRTTR